MNNHSIKICHACFSFTTGGIENLLVDVLNEQAQKIDVTLIIVNKSYDFNIIKRLSPKVRLILINRRPGNKFDILSLMRLWFLILKINPKFIHCHTHNLIQILAPFKTKCIYTVHQIGIPLKYLRRYRHVFSISSAVKSDLKKRLGIHSTIVYNGINFSTFIKRKDYVIDHEIKIVQIGRLVHQQKGQDILIKCMLGLKDYYKNIHLDIIGNGPSKDYLESLICDYRLTNFVTLIGNRDRSWICANLNKYNILVQPSRSEGFGLTIIEAIAAGLPVLASDVDGPSEILKNVASASLFLPENIDDLIYKIKKIILDYLNNRIEQKCEEGYKEIQKRFSVSITASRYLNYYRAELIQDEKEDKELNSIHCI